jgi:hypothetical protein
VIHIWISKIPTLLYTYLKTLEWKMSVYLMAIWHFLRNLVHLFMVIRFVLWSFGKKFPHFGILPQENLATLKRVPFLQDRLTVQEREREEARQRQAEREAQQVEPQFAR